MNLLLYLIVTTGAWGSIDLDDPREVIRLRVGEVVRLILIRPDGQHWDFTFDRAVLGRTGTIEQTIFDAVGVGKTTLVGVRARGNGKPSARVRVKVEVTE